MVTDFPVFSVVEATGIEGISEVIERLNFIPR
jgi:hypothetical protein